MSEPNLTVDLKPTTAEERAAAKGRLTHWGLIPVGPFCERLIADVDRLEQENAQLRADRERLLEVLQPFAACVSSDNGDITVSQTQLHAGNWLAAYNTLYSASRVGVKPIGPLDPSDCTRDPSHDGPCNGYPRQDCAIDAARNPQRILQHDGGFLSWLRDRIVYQYGEDPDTDFVLRLGKIIERIGQPCQCCRRNCEDGCLCMVHKNE